MRCKKVKTLLLTDYMDDETDNALRLLVDSHIKTCPSCGDYKAGLDRSFAFLSSDVESQPPGEEMWNTIQSRLSLDKKDIKDKVFFLKPIFKKSMFAFAAAAILLLAITVFNNVRNNQMAGLNSFLSGEAEFMYRLTAGEARNLFNGTDFGTSIEEWFL